MHSSVVVMHCFVSETTCFPCAWRILPIPFTAHCSLSTLIYYSVLSFVSQIRGDLTCLRWPAMIGIRCLEPQWTLYCSTLPLLSSGSPMFSSSLCALLRAQFILTIRRDGVTVHQQVCAFVIPYQTYILFVHCVSLPNRVHHTSFVRSLHKTPCKRSTTYC